MLCLPVLLGDGWSWPRATRQHIVCLSGRKQLLPRAGGACGAMDWETAGLQRPEPILVRQPCTGSGMWKLDVGRGLLVAILSIHLFTCSVAWAPSHHPANGNQLEDFGHFSAWTQQRRPRGVAKP